MEGSVAEFDVEKEEVEEGSRAGKMGKIGMGG